MKKIVKELNDKSIKQLLSEEQSTRSEIAKLILESKVNPPKDTNTLTKKRKRLAALLTILTEKKEIEKLKNEVKT